MKKIFIWLISLQFLFGYGYIIKDFDSEILISSKEKKIKNHFTLAIQKSSKKLDFSYPIAEDYEVLPTLFSIKDKIYKVYLKNNRVFFSVFDVKKGEDIEVKIQYKTLNNQKFFQTQRIYIPRMPNTFNAKIKINIDKDWELISQNNLFTRQGQLLLWEGKIQKGFNDYLWLSVKKANWDIMIKNYIYTSDKINNLNVFIPKYFKDSGIKVKKLDFDINSKQAQVIQKQNNTSVVFRNAQMQDFVLKINAQVSNVLEYSYKNLNPKDFLSKQEKSELKKVAQQIIRDNTKESPYIAIAKWVYQSIKYNEKYTNVHMSSDQILKVKNGVCEHYAQLYNDLLQSLDIPSAFVTGVGFNPTKRAFEYHAWNLVYVDEEWRPIDSTWGLFGGKLPISHIFFYIGYQPLLMYETYDIPIEKTHTEVEQKIRFIP